MCVSRFGAFRTDSHTPLHVRTYLAFWQGTSILALVCTSRFGAFRTDSYTPSEFHSAMQRCKAHKKRFATPHCTVESTKGSVCTSVWTAPNRGAEIKVEKMFCNAAFQFRDSMHIPWASNPAIYQCNRHSAPLLGPSPIWLGFVGVRAHISYTDRLVMTLY